MGSRKPIHFHMIFIEKDWVENKTEQKNCNQWNWVTSFTKFPRMKNNCYWWIIIIHALHNTHRERERARDTQRDRYTCVLHIMANYSQTVVIWDLIVADLCNPFDLHGEQTMEMPVPVPMHSGSCRCSSVVSVFAYGTWLRLFDNSWVEPTESLLSYLHLLYVYTVCVSACTFWWILGNSSLLWRRTRQIYGIHESHSKPRAFNLIWLLDKYFHFNLFQQFTTL